MNSYHDEWLRIYAAQLQEMTQHSTDCPECGKHGFSIVRKHGVGLYNCFKAGCGFSGRVDLHGYSAVPQEVQEPSIAPLSPYYGPSRILSHDAAWLISGRFGISVDAAIRYIAEGTGTYLLSIESPKGVSRGIVERHPWERTAYDRTINYCGPKSRIYKAKHEPMISWYRPDGVDDKDIRAMYATVLVEDQMSAIKLADNGFLACALLGTSLNSEKVAEIQSVSKHATLALDSDATATAFRLARKWQHAFSSFRVGILEKDCKDMTKEEIHAKFH